MKKKNQNMAQKSIYIKNMQNILNLWENQKKK